MTALGLGPRLRLSPRRRRRPQPQPGFAPNQLPGLAFWYDAALSQVTETGGTIEQWNDLSGNNNHAVQAQSTQRPIKTADVAGRALVRFDGANDVLLVSNPPSLASGITMFVVFRMRSRADFTGIVSASAATGPDHAQFFTLENAHASEQVFRLFAKSIQIDNVAIENRVDSTETQYAIFTIGTDIAEFRDLNGQMTDASTAVSFGTPAAIVLGARYNLGAPFNFCAVDIHEVGLFSRVLASVELDQIEAYLKARHGLTWTPMHIGKDLAWYHDAVDSGVTLSGNLVDQWNDRTAATRHWIQTSNARPQKTVDDEGRSVVRFDGIDDVMEMAGTLPVLEPFSVGVVYRVRNRGDFEGVLSAAPASGADQTDFWSFQSESAASSNMRVAGRALEADELLLIRADSGFAQIAIWTAGTGSAELRDQNGSVSDTYGGAFTTPAEIILGGRYDGAPFGYAEIDAMATVGISRVLSAVDQQRLIDWATAKWSL